MFKKIVIAKLIFLVSFSCFAQKNETNLKDIKKVKESLLLEKKKELLQKRTKEIRDAYKSKQMARKHNNFPIQQ